MNRELEIPLPPPRPLQRVIDVASRLGVNRSNVYQIMDRGELPYVKIGKNRRVRPEDVDRLIESSTVGQR